MNVKTNLPFIFKAACFCMLFWTSAAADTSPFEHWERDSFDDAKGTPLYDALLAIQNIAAAPITGIEISSPEYKPDKRTITEIYSTPELADPILVVLDAVEKTGLDQLPKSVRYHADDVIIGAVASGKGEFVPALKRLARSPEVKVRKAVANQAAIRISPSPSLDVMKESLSGALEHIPQEISNTFEYRTRVDEFTSAVYMYCECSTLKQRQEIRPLVEKFLKRGGSKFEKFYRPKLEETLKAESPRMKYAEARATKRTVPDTGKSGDKPAFQPFLVCGIVILIIIGFLWLAIKRRQRV